MAGGLHTPLDVEQLQQRGDLSAIRLNIVVLVPVGEPSRLGGHQIEVHEVIDLPPGPCVACVTKVVDAECFEEPTSVESAGMVCAQLPEALRVSFTGVGLA